jgi:AAA15 family ATPase/GTPase
MAIKTISIQGYRSIQNMRLTMDDINVIVGANGCGKSNLYKAVYLLAKRVSGKGNITHAAILMNKLNPYYGDRFKDKLCFSDLNITVI